MKFSHIALNCTDVEKTIDFYSKHFKFSVGRRLPIGSQKEIIFLKRDDVHLELFPVDGPVGMAEKDGPNSAGTLRHIAFQVDSVDATLQEMGADAILALGPLDFETFIPGWRTAWIRDPNGHIVEISQGYVDA